MHIAGQWVSKKSSPNLSRGLAYNSVKKLKFFIIVLKFYFKNFGFCKFKGCFLKTSSLFLPSPRKDIFLQRFVNWAEIFRICFTNWYKFFRFMHKTFPSSLSKLYIETYTRFSASDLTGHHFGFHEKSLCLKQ